MSHAHSHTHTPRCSVAQVRRPVTVRKPRDVGCIAATRETKIIWVAVCTEDWPPMNFFCQQRVLVEKERRTLGMFGCFFISVRSNPMNCLKSTTVAATDLVSGFSLTLQSLTHSYHFDLPVVVLFCFNLLYSETLPFTRARVSVHL